MTAIAARLRKRQPRTSVGGATVAGVGGATAAGWAVVHAVHLAAAAATPTLAAAVHFVCRIP
jgi:hypothetical protein